MSFRPLIGVALLAACSQQPRADNAAVALPSPAASATPAAIASPAPAASPAVALLGRWRGVEGMFLVVSDGDAPGRYRLEMQYDLDHRQTTDATLENGALVFERDGARAELRPTDGAATGLKYLAGKRDCLTVKPGEGYCRD